MMFDVSKFACFGNAAEDEEFIFVADETVAAEIGVEDLTSKYRRVSTLTVRNYTDIVEFLRNNKSTRKSMLVAAPSIYFRSPEPDVLGNGTKLAVLASYSTPSSIDSVRHFLAQAQSTRSENQDLIAESFFASAQRSAYLVFRDTTTGCSAQFEHLDDHLSWHEQVGVLDYGQQQLLPSGEISTLPVNVFGEDIRSSFALTGRLCLTGHVVLHGGSVSYTTEDQARIYAALASIRENPVYLDLTQGRIAAIDADPQDHAAATMLRHLIDVDSRYGTVIEIGFGINTELQLLDGNFAMNEVYGGRRGVVHFGFGLIPYTQFHLDVLCPNTVVLNDKGEVLLGGP